MGVANDSPGFSHYAVLVNSLARDAHAPAWKALRAFHDSDQEAAAALWQAVPDSVKGLYPDGPTSVRAMDFLGMWGRGTNFPGRPNGPPPEVFSRMLQRSVGAAPNAFDLEGKQYDFLHDYPTPSGPMPPAGSFRLSPEELRNQKQHPLTPAFSPVI